MPGLPRELAAVPRSGSTWRRWAHLILGGAMLVPYATLGSTVAQALSPWAGAGAAIAAALAVTVALVLATGLVPAVRELEVAAARVLLRPRGGLTAAGGARPSWSARWRSAQWFAAHLLTGGAVSLLTLVLPPAAAVALTVPFRDGEVSVADLGISVAGGPARAWVPVVALAAVAGLVFLVAATGALMARLAPALLGPSPSERLAALQRETARLAERNRLARELHDSVGHALGIVSIQAAAAERVLDRDPAFARQALRDIAASARGGMRDLDHVLGLLRDQPAATGPAPALADLDRLLEATRSTGVDVGAELRGDLDRVPGALSREAYRIVQEGLTNAVRHARAATAGVRVTVAGDRLEIELTNPLPAEPAPRGEGGGRGLVGIRERVGALQGRVTAGPEGSRWRLAVELPLHPAP